MSGIWRFGHEVATVLPHSRFNKWRLTISVDIRIDFNDPTVFGDNRQPAGRVLTKSTRSERGRRKFAPAMRKSLTALLGSLCLLFVASAAAQAETRTLKLYFIHTHERAEIAYKRDGKFIPSGLKQINNFLRDWRKNEPTNMDPRVVDLLWEVYHAVGAKDYIHIVSAYRSPKTNAMLRSRSKGVAEKSQHMLGKAIDFYIPGVKLATLRRTAMRFQVGGVGYYPTSGSPFVHIDVGNARYWPRMSRGELMAMFPDGNTVYLPADGKPLAGYSQAMASYKSRRKDISEIQLASASDKPRRGFLANLFGGGADEEEDSAQVEVASAPVAAAGRAAVAAASAPEPAATPATILAAMPAQAVPLPGVAPRPSVGVGVPLAVAAEPVEPAPAPGEVELAMNVPLPTPRPDYTPPAPAAAQAPVQVAEAESGQIAAQIAGVHVTGADVMAGITGKGAPPEPAATLAAYLPASGKPSDGEQQVMIAALPEPRPTLDAPKGAAGNSEAALARAEAKEMVDERLARLASAPSASPRLALISRDEGTDPAEIMGTGPRTTAKGGRPTIADEKPDPRSITIPVPQQVARWALSNEPVRLDTRGTRAPSFAHAFVRSAPQVVYTAGFQTASIGDINRFSGPAVVFLSVARFQTN